jgi:hypothetical protein
MNNAGHFFFKNFHEIALNPLVSLECNSSKSGHLLWLSLDHLSRSEDPYMFEAACITVDRDVWRTQ